MKQEAELRFWQGESRNIEDHDLTRYPRHLMLPADFFTGMRVLDVGCGPIPYASAFTGCNMWGIDPLLEGYREAGYDLSRMTYICAPAERMPFDDGFFDAVISMNALDHVDDFDKTAAEIRRVAKHLIHLEVHYHEPTVCEPHRLDDDRMRSAFPGMNKLVETPYDAYYPGARGSVAVWTSL